LSLIQSSKLTKQIDFKLQTKISVIASIFSGIIAITMAYTGFGVWSLIAKSLTQQGFNSILLWYWNKWKPDLLFSIESFKELFGFGSKLLISGLIGTLLQNINYIVIAKYFTPQDLGYFTRAEMFQKLPSENISSIITSVGYPVLATIQEDKLRMKEVFRKMFVNTFFIITILMVGMASTAKALILTLVGEQWMPSVILLQMLCFLGIILPLASMNVSILSVVGRSDLYLKLQLYVQLLAIPNIFLGIFYGIKALIIGMILIESFGYVIFNHESNKILNYPIKEQLQDIMPGLLLALSMAIIVLAIGYLTAFSPIITLTIQVLAGMIVVVVAGEILKLDEYIFLKTTFLEKIRFTKMN
jgi:O-antigen/teichoic acid export membrane protein